MVDFEKLYHKMVLSSEQAIHALNKGNIDEAKQILMKAEQDAEAEYIENE